MKSTFNWQQFKGLFFVQSLLVLLVAAADRASAIDIKDTNYPIPSGAYFVSPNGLDSNSGKTPDSPWPVAKAIASAPSGSTIVFKGGTYRNVDAKINKKLTLQAYPHEKPWIKGSINVEGWVADGRIWRKDGWSDSFAPNMSRKYIDPKHPLAGYRDMVYLNGVSLKQVGKKAQVVTGTFYVDAVNDKLYIGNNPADKTVEATVLEEAFNMWTFDSSKPSGTVVRGLGFAHYAERAITVATPNVTLENNTFAWNGIQGVTFMGQSGKTLGVSSDAIVRGNTFSYNGRNGIGGSRAHRLLLEDNTISHNNVERFAITWDAAGIKFLWSNGVIWRNNLVENNYATGMWLDQSSTNATIVKNTIRHNKGIGLLFELSHKAIIAANLVYKNATAGIMISESSSARVYNNTLSMNNKHIVVKDDRRKNTKTAEVAAGITWSTHGNVIKNNILSSARGTALFEASDCTTKKQSALMIDTADYNGYYRPSSKQSQSLIKWSLGKGKCSVRYSSIAAFDAATNFEANALAVDNVTTNPFFVDEINEDYRLKLNSPAIGRSSPLPADIAKAIGLPPGTPLDLGALQSKVH